MAKKIRIVTNAIVPSAAFVLNKVPPPAVGLDGYYGADNPGGAPINVSVQVTGSQFLDLYDDSDVYIGTFTIADLPPGFKVDSIDQFGGIPSSSSGGGAFMLIPISVAGGTVINDWNAGILPLSNLGSVYVPATMSFWWLSGFWIFTANVTIPAGVSWTSGAMIASQTKAVIASHSPQIFTGQFEDDVPLMIYTGTWSVDESLCPVIDALTNVQIVDPVTGEFSWTYPSGITRVVITLSQVGHDDVVVPLSSPVTSYIPVDIYGNVTVTIVPVSDFPICYGPESTLNLSITSPFVFTGGGSGGNQGIDIGGAATIQFIGNPSGIYTLVPDSTHDTLLERIPTTTTQNVKIPNPKVRFGFVGD